MTLRAVGVASAIVVAAAPVPGVAATVAGAECLSIPEQSARLACFDRAVGEAARATGGAEAAGQAPAQPTATAAAAGTAASTTTAAATGTVAESGAPTAAPPSMIDAAWGFLPDSQKAYVRPYLPNYLLFAQYTNNVNTAPYEPLLEAFADEYDLEHVEAAFQISFKGRLLTTDDRRWGLWFAYSQQSQWQVYSGDLSRPFRETNYMPELFGSFRPGVDVGSFKFNLLNFGYTHESNGRADPISRSWDRIFVEGGFEKQDLALIVRAWARITPGDYQDDNPDIMDYMGYGQVTALYHWHDNSFSLMGRGNLSTGKGAVQFSWTSRPILGPLHAYFQLFSGYGESMIDYNWNQTSVGIGIALNDQL